MRKIKFRGKRVDDGEWVYGNIYTEQHSEIVYIVTYIMPDELFDTEITEVIPETVGQFTGLQDKNGKDIYEGDIVDMCIDYGGDGINEPNTVDEFNGEVIYCQSCCSFGIQSETNDNDITVPLLEDVDIEIIGNIHEESKWNQL